MDSTGKDGLRKRAAAEDSRASAAAQVRCRCRPASFGLQTQLTSPACSVSSMQPETNTAFTPPSCSLLRKLSGTIAAWDAPLQQLLQGPAALIPPRPSMMARPALLFWAASTASEGALKAMEYLRPTAEAVMDVCRLVTLSLGTGRLLASQAPAALRLFAVTFPGQDASLNSTEMGTLLALQANNLQLCITLAASVGTLRLLAQQLVPARAVVPWLRELTPALQCTRPGELTDTFTLLTLCMLGG